MEIIKNEWLTVSIKAEGAEIQNIVCNKSGREYIWQGDAKYWGGRSPILFPIVGGMWDGKCGYAGRELKIEKHGFVRKATWSVAAQTADSVTYAYTPEAELEEYPFPCRVEVKYSLDENKVAMHFKVVNLGTDTMYFQIGGHPGFQLPDFAEDREVVGYIRLEGAPESVVRASTQGCTTPERFAYPKTESGLVPICVSTFENEALIFDEYQVKAATLLTLDEKPLARVECSSPVFLFWQPQGIHSPFLCIEPWYGLCDQQGFNGDIAERPYMQKAKAGEAWDGELIITLF